MDFVLTGFRQEANIRRFAFQRVAGDHSRTEFTVSADMSLLVKHKIPLQELPLLCRALLEDQQQTGPAKAVHFHRDRHAGVREPPQRGEGRSRPETRAAPVAIRQARKTVGIETPAYS